ncbi:uncharacterized protein ARMOST_17157 [Armillaria ostoyae]|uniref:Uncharacterized protein n=1 Tax=Armillaria ostoyae TaxID=47428 RepID=A0A284RY82_ARMOS|nr:uncharacterized protein ARMOST_17157 [Armillaria ostoyae]
MNGGVNHEVGILISHFLIMSASFDNLIAENARPSESHGSTIYRHPSSRSKQQRDEPTTHTTTIGQGGRLHHRSESILLDPLETPSLRSNRIGVNVIGTSPFIVPCYRTTREYRAMVSCAQVGASAISSSIMTFYSVSVLVPVLQKLGALSSRNLLLILHSRLCCN